MLRNRQNLRLFKPFRTDENLRYKKPEYKAPATEKKSTTDYDEVEQVNKNPINDNHRNEMSPQGATPTQGSATPTSSQTQRNSQETTHPRSATPAHQWTPTPSQRSQYGTPINHRISLTISPEATPRRGHEITLRRVSFADGITSQTTPDAAKEEIPICEEMPEQFEYGVGRRVRKKPRKFNDYTKNY